MSHLILLRHGKTEINEWNDEHPTKKKIGGQLESPLLKEGREGAVEAGKQIAVMNFNILFAVSSDHARAVDTRDLVLQQLPNPNIRKDAIPGLREISYGEFAGKSEEEVRQAHPQFFDNPALNKWRGNFDQKAPGGENYRDISKRLKKDVLPLLTNGEDDKLVISSRHTLRVLLHQLLNLTEEETYLLQILNTDPIVLRQESNDTFSLAPPNTRCTPRRR